MTDEEENQSDSCLQAERDDKYEKNKPLTPGLRKVLHFIAKNPRCRADDIARYMWPNSKMHTQSSNQGHGACRGKVAWLAGGAIASKLIHKGLVRSDYVNSRSASRVVYLATYEGLQKLKKKEF